jgi:predicted nuclease with TOPRIM domain
VPAAPDRGPATITRIVPTTDLPPGVCAVATSDGSTILVSSALDQAGRRRAVRKALAAAHRHR